MFYSTTLYQRSAEAHFPDAKVVGDGPWICLSDCKGRKIAYLFPDEIQRATAMLKCCPKCKGTNHHTARRLKENVYLPCLPFQNPVNTAT